MVLENLQIPTLMKRATNSDVSIYIYNTKTTIGQNVELGTTNDTVQCIRQIDNVRCFTTIPLPGFA